MPTKYNEVYQKSIQDADGFWSELANDVFWYKKPKKYSRLSCQITVADELDGMVVKMPSKQA